MHILPVALLALTTFFYLLANAIRLIVLSARREAWKFYQGGVMDFVFANLCLSLVIIGQVGNTMSAFWNVLLWVATAGWIFFGVMDLGDAKRKARHS